MHATNRIKKQTTYKIIIMEKEGMDEAPALFGRKARARRKVRRAKRQTKRADRIEKRGGSAGRVEKLRGRASGNKAQAKEALEKRAAKKAGRKARRSKMKAAIKSGVKSVSKTAKDFTKKAGSKAKGAARKVGKAAGSTLVGQIGKAAVKGAKNLKGSGKVKAALKKSPGGKLVKKVAGVGKKAVKGAKKVARKTTAAVAAFKGTAKYGEGMHMESASMEKKNLMTENPIDNDMSRKADSPAKYGMDKGGMGMYGKGSKISYGHRSGMNIKSYAKAGGKTGGLSSYSNKPGMLNKHMKRK